MASFDVYSTATCYAADKAAPKLGATAIALMEAAGAGIAERIISRFAPCPVLVFCGPGSNGGDGYVVARHLHLAGWSVVVSKWGHPPADTEAAAMEELLPTDIERLDSPTEIPSSIQLIVDCLLGAGISRPVSGELADLIAGINQHPAKLVSADLPSGVFGDLQVQWEGEIPSVKADLTITFECMKPAHVLEPGRSQCGEVEVIKIGFPKGLMESFSPIAVQNHRSNWPQIPRIPNQMSHKHNRGRLLVLCGEPLRTGAARLAAIAGLRIGAGWVTLAGSAASMEICANHETSVVLVEREPEQSLLPLIETQKPDCMLIGPAGGLGVNMRADVLAALGCEVPIVLDADALSAFSTNPEMLFSACHSNTVLVPHEGEFARLFALFGPKFGNKIDRVRAAAKLAGCTVLLKGADSVIASPSGKVVVNNHTSNWLATLGTGDVLAGMVAGLMAQGHCGFDALCAGVWMHGDLGRRLGPGLIAEDLPASIASMLQDLLLAS